MTHLDMTLWAEVLRSCVTGYDSPIRNISGSQSQGRYIMYAVGYYHSGEIAYTCYSEDEVLITGDSDCATEIPDDASLPIDGIVWGTGKTIEEAALFASMQFN